MTREIKVLCAKKKYIWVRLPNMREPLDTVTPVLLLPHIPSIDTYIFVSLSRPSFTIVSVYHTSL